MSSTHLKDHSDMQRLVVGLKDVSLQQLDYKDGKPPLDRTPKQDVTIKKQLNGRSAVTSGNKNKGRSVADQLPENSNYTSFGGSRNQNRNQTVTIQPLQQEFSNDPAQTKTPRPHYEDHEKFFNHQVETPKMKGHALQSHGLQGQNTAGSDFPSTPIKGHYQLNARGTSDFHTRANSYVRSDHLLNNLLPEITSGQQSVIDSIPSALPRSQKHNPVLAQHKNSLSPISNTDSNYKQFKSKGNFAEYIQQKQKLLSQTESVQQAILANKDLSAATPDLTDFLPGNGKSAKKKTQKAQSPLMPPTMPTPVSLQPPAATSTLQQKLQKEEEFKMLLMGQRVQNQTLKSPDRQSTHQSEKTSPRRVIELPGLIIQNALHQNLSPPQMAKQPDAPTIVVQQQMTNHYLYDYLFIQMHSDTFDKDYQHRLALHVSGEYDSPEQDYSTQIDQLSLDTQFTQLKVIKESSDENHTGFTLAMFNQTIKQLRNDNKRVKTTVQRKYVNDLLTSSKGSHNVAQKIVLLIYHSAFNKAVVGKVSKKKRASLAVTDQDEALSNAEEEEKSPRKAKRPKNRVQSVETSENEDNDSQSTSSTQPQQLAFKSGKVGSGSKQPSETPKKQKSASKRLNSASRLNSQASDHESKPSENKKHFPKCKIKIWHAWEPSPELVKSPINKMFQAYNEFCRIVFFNKHAYQDNHKEKLPQLLKLAKKLGLVLLKGQLNPNQLFMKEHSNLLKEQLIRSWCRTIQQENEPSSQLDHLFPKKKVHEQNVKQIEQDQTYAQSQEFSGHYKVFVGKGNNSVMVRSLFKTRFWWLLHDKEEVDKINLIWTQVRKVDILKQFKSKFHQSQAPEIKTAKRKRANSQSGRDVEPEQPPVKSVPTNQGNFKMEAYPLKAYNKLEDNYHLSNKKALFLNMKYYYEAIGQDPYNSLPMTFHVKSGLDDPQFQKFKTTFEESQNDKQNIWIIKPGEYTNQGKGISVSKDYAEIQSLIEEFTRSKKRTCIIQKYISNPLLINKRKFDIRTFCLMTSVNGNLKGYYYDEGYLRTSSREFNMKDLSNKLVHLTNDCIQKKAEDYGKYESGNKQSYQDFQAYCDKYHESKHILFDRDIAPQLKKLTSDCMRAVWSKIDPFKRVNTFEVYGLDFMLDDEFKPYLIEVNTNPSLELSCPLLARMIPQMLESSFRIVADPMFPPPDGFSQKKSVVQELVPECKYQLVFDETIDAPFLHSVFKTKDNIIVEIDEDELSDCEEEDMLPDYEQQQDLTLNE